MQQFTEGAVLITEAAGMAAILLGALAATLLFMKAVIARGEFSLLFQTYRQRLGQAILLGLELLVAADIINTVALDPSPQSVAVLGAIVLVRTFLSFALEVELEGRWPWRRADATARGTPRAATNDERERKRWHPRG